MGAGASSVGKAKGANKDTITEGVQTLSYKDKAVLKQAIEASLGGDSKSIAENVKLNAENDALIHAVSLTVMTNKQGIFEARSMMEENRNMILQNYQAAVTGNRNMAIENTDAIFKNRSAILDALKVQGPVEENFRASKKNETAVAYLENVCLLNNRIAKVNDKMSEANADLIAVNELILKSNEEIQAFNVAQTDTNKKLMEGVKDEKATPEANAARIAANKEKIEKIKQKNEAYNAEMAAMHAKQKENRKNIEANAAEIKDRRKKILDNRKTIDENGLKVCELLKVDCFAEVATALDALSDEEKGNIKDALNGPPCAASAEAKQAIKENAAKLHELSLTVFTNKSKLLAARSMIEENRAMLFKNYTCAFGGNRLMLNQNTDCIFKNRKAILKALKCQGDSKMKNFRNSKMDEAKIDFLQHRSELNNRIAKTNVLIASANAKLIEANAMVLKSNEETVKFNTEQLETNTKLLAGITAEKATVEANAERTAKNKQGIAMIIDHAQKYDGKVEDFTKLALENRKKIIANAKLIDERRGQIVANRGGIIENGQAIIKQMLA